MILAEPVATLPDITSRRQSASNVLDWVGMEGIALPVHWAGQQLHAKVDAGVSLDDPQAKGIHMSRLYLALSTLSTQALSVESLHQLLSTFLNSQNELTQRASVTLRFDLPLQRAALISPLSGWKYYPVTVQADLIKGANTPTVKVSLELLYSSTCPCSAALARQLIQQQFSRDFEHQDLSADAIHHWLGSSQGIVATPHSQRSSAHIQLSLRHQHQLCFEDWLDVAEQALATPVQTAVKRADEQAFALTNGQNLMFCEDAARRLHQVFSQRSDLNAFSLRVVHAESLHAHDAVARSSWRRETT